MSAAIAIVPKEDNEESKKAQVIARQRLSALTAAAPSNSVAVAAPLGSRVALLLGLVNMMRGGSPNTSQKLMRLRVLLQFVAIVVIMLAIWVMAR